MEILGNSSHYGLSSDSSGVLGLEPMEASIKAIHATMDINVNVMHMEKGLQSQVDIR
jgi:hypothetical protein